MNQDLPRLPLGFLWGYNDTTQSFYFLCSQHLRKIRESCCLTIYPPSVYEYCRPMKYYTAKGSDGVRTSSRKRTCSDGSSRKAPRNSVVTVATLRFSTPRRDMHMCTASI